MMTKKHYEAIAQEIALAKHRGTNAYEIIAHRLADYFEQDNPKFDRVRFLEACGVECNHRYFNVNMGVKCEYCGIYKDGYHIADKHGYKIEQ